MELFEWQTSNIDFDPTETERYLQRVWDSRPVLSGRYSDTLAGITASSRKQRFLDLRFDTIQARNYVGFIQHDDVRIEILPRVFKGKQLSTSDRLHHLLTWLGYGRRLNFPFVEQGFNSTDCPDSWLEAVIFIFANYATSVLTVSPYHQYEEVSEETAFVKGRLNIPRLIQYQLSTGRHHHVYCDHAPLVYDNEFNRIVKWTCRLLSAFSDRAVNQSLLSNLIFLLDEVSDIPATGADCDRIVLSRLHPEKTLLKNFCKLFLNNSRFDPDQAREHALCVLIPMEVLFEELTFGLIEKFHGNLDPRRQASDIYLAQTGKDWSTNVFQIQQDILIPGKLIIDTKYKFRASTDDNTGGVDQADLYQMMAYAHRRGTEQVLLLYPQMEGADNSDFSFRIISEFDGKSVQVEVRSLDIVVDNLTTFEETLRGRLRGLHNVLL